MKASGGEVGRLSIVGGVEVSSCQQFHLISCLHFL